MPTPYTALPLATRALAVHARPGLPAPGAPSGRVGNQPNRDGEGRQDTDS
jgi:hypothetical protein